MSSDDVEFWIGIEGGVCSFFLGHFLGLKQGKVYTDTSDLRYGSLMIMADQVGFLFCSASEVGSCKKD